MTILDDVQSQSSDDPVSFEIDADAFYDAVRECKRILPSRKSDMPVSPDKCLQITIDGERVHVWGSNGRLQMVTSFDDVSIESTGHLSIAVRLLKKPISKMRRHVDTFYVTSDPESNTIQIESDQASFEESLAYHGSDVPDLVPTNVPNENGYDFHAPYREIRHVFDSVGMCADQGAETRAFLRDIKIHDDGHMIASDGSIIGSGSLDLNSDHDYQIRAEDFDTIQTTFSKTENVSVVIHDGHLHIRGENGLTCSITCVEDEGYPDLRPQIDSWDKTMGCEASCDRGDMEEAVEFLDALRYGNGRLIISSDNGELVITNEDDDTDRSSSHRIDIEGDDMPSHQVKKAYITSILDEAQSDRLQIKTSNDDGMPLCIQEKDQGGVIWYVMKIGDRTFRD